MSQATFAGTQPRGDGGKTDPARPDEDLLADLAEAIALVRAFLDTSLQSGAATNGRAWKGRGAGRVRATNAGGAACPHPRPWAGQRDMVLTRS